MRILCQTDSCFIPSGQARVGREIAIGLAKRGHEMGYIGWFHRQDIFPNLPFNIQFWQTNNSLYGSDVLDAVIQKFQPDILLTIGDFWWLSYIADPSLCRTRRLFQWCSYIPVDGEPSCGGIPPDLVPVIEDVDIPVAYTNYAMNAVMKSCSDQETRRRIQVIYHGVDTNVFKPDPEVKRKLKEQYGIGDRFVFLTVCRNQQRKNIPYLFEAWKIFSEMPSVKGRVVLWPHMYFSDPAGWNIYNLLKVKELQNESIMYFTSIANSISEQHLLDEQKLAQLYQMADAFILLSGEGFGLPTFEAMATKLPCVLLNHSASAELGSDGRAELVDCVPTTWTGPHLTERPLPDVQKSVEAMLRIFQNVKYRNDMAEKGYNFVQNYTWDKVLESWNILLMHYEVPFVRPFELEVVT